MYALEHRIRDRSGDRRYLRCGICGNRALLERIRKGQERPKDWRVVRLKTAFPTAAERAA